MAIDFDIQFPSQQMVQGYVDRWSFDRARFISPRLGIELDDTSQLNSPAAIVYDVLAATEGMTLVSAMDADPLIIAPRKISTVTHEPLYFKEMRLIGEKQITNARMLGRQDMRAGDALIRAAVDQINIRIDTLLEWSIMQMLTGTLKVAGRDRVDYGMPESNKINTGVTTGYSGYWSSASATPIDDIRKAAELLRYKGASGIKLVVDQSIMARISTLCTDILKQSTLAVSLGPEKIAELLPGILGCGIDEVIMNTQGFRDEDGKGKSFIPDGYVFLVGMSMDGPVGAWRSTPTAYKSDANGNFQCGRFVNIHNLYAESRGTIPKVEVIGGIYGLPVLYRPDLVVAMKVMNV